MKKCTGYRFYMVLLSALVVLLDCVMPNSYAQTGLSVVHNDYDALSVNHVEVEPLKFSEGEFSTDNPDIKQGEFAEYEPADKSVHSVHAIAYHGQVKWGRKNTTTQQSADMEKNVIPGTFSMRFENRAKLSDGTRADVVFRFSNWEVYLGAQPENITSANKVFVQVVSGGIDGSLFKYVTKTVRTGGGEEDALVCSVKQRIKTTVTIVTHGTDTPIDKKYDQMLVGFRDLDVPDNSIAGSADPKERYAGRFAESIELISGFFEPILLTEEGSTKMVIGTSDGNMYIRGTEVDSGTLDSGFVCGAAPQGYSYYWYGSTNYGAANNGLSYMATGIAELGKVSVSATKGQGGTIEKQGSMAYVLNGTTSYKYMPDDGYYVKSLTVDGEEADFDPEGGTYVFDKLTSTDAEGDDHTIDVRFEAYPKIEIEKSVSNETPEMGDEVKYTIEIRQTNDDAVFRSAVMTDELPEGIEIIEDTLECSEDGEVSFQDGVITYLQDELAGDAAISFRAVVTEQSGIVRNNAVLTGEKAEPVEDDAVITISKANEDETVTEDIDGDDAPDENAGKEHSGEPPYDGDEGSSVDDTRDDSEDDTYDYEDNSPKAPKTGDNSAANVPGLICLIMLSALLIIRITANKKTH